MSQGTLHSIILIDDECVMCNRLIRLVAAADSKDLFRITGLDSIQGLALLENYHIDNPGKDRLILLEQNAIYEASEAICRILNQLKYYSWLGTCLRVLPVKFRDSVYYTIARNRYKIFGKAKKCSTDEKFTKKILR